MLRRSLSDSSRPRAFPRAAIWSNARDFIFNSSTFTRADIHSFDVSILSPSPANRDTKPTGIAASVASILVHRIFRDKLFSWFIGARLNSLWLVCQGADM